MVKCELRVDCGLSEAHIARHSSPTPLVYVIMPMVANHAIYFCANLSQFPSGSVSVNLAFQLSDQTLKSSYQIKNNVCFEVSTDMIQREGVC